MKRYIAFFLCTILLFQSGANFVAAARQIDALPEPVQQPLLQSPQSGQDVWYVFNLEETPLVGGINQAYVKQGNSAGQPAKESKGGSHKEIKENGKTVGHTSQNKILLKYDNPGQLKIAAWDSIKVNLKNGSAPMLADIQPVGSDGIQIILDLRKSLLR